MHVSPRHLICDLAAIAVKCFVNMHHTELKVVLHLLSCVGRSLAEEKCAMFKLRRQILMVLLDLRKKSTLQLKTLEMSLPTLYFETMACVKTCTE
jgi:hypothetical protein